MKRMLFNATQAEELRVAIVDGQKLIDLDIESASKEQRKSNIYKAVITRIEPSLEACFVDYGAERNGFLPFKEVSRIYFQSGVEVSRAKIQEALKEGQELIVQVDKDERGNKGAALTTYVSLAGRYLVLMPNNPRGGGVSRRVDGDERAELREIMDQLAVPNGMSLIARTAAIGRQAEELQWDLNYLLQLWTAIEGAAKQQSGAFLIYLEGSLVIRAIRDYFHSEIGEILIDTDEVYDQARAFMSTVMPGNVNRVKRYRDDVPLFSRFQIEHQIETAFVRQVNLPSGGAIVIDHTEALVAVDVNSGRATKGADIEETAYKTNLEAAEELARQLRLRDLGGLIVIDFIDMENQKNQREVENRLRDALRFDRARVQMGKISRFGLMELSRQRLRPALAETSYISCPRCTGTGHIRSTESAALHILRILEEEAMKDNTGAVHVQVPVDVATFLLNEKRPEVQAIEARHKVTILLIPNIHLETPAHSITRLKHDDLNGEEMREPSYKMVDAPAEEAPRTGNGKDEASKPRQEAAIKGISPDQPAPVMQEKTTEAALVAPPESGLLSRITSWLFGSTPKAPEPAPTPVASPKKGRDTRNEGRRERGEGRGRNARGGRNRDEERTEERGNRNERGERNAGKAPREEAVGSGERPERQERRPRGERKERRERQQPEIVEDKLTSEIVADVAINRPGSNNESPENGNGEEQGARRRGRRGGRGRGERRNDSENVVTANEALEANTPMTGETKAPEDQQEQLVVAPPTATEPTAVVEQETATIVVASTPTELIAEPIAPAATPTPEPVVYVSPVAAEPAVTLNGEVPPVEQETATVVVTSTPAELVVESLAPAPEPVVAREPEPVVVAPVDLQASLAESGLVLVQTTTAAVVTQQEPPVKLGRPRKQKALDEQPEEAPLQMVETLK